LGQYLKGRWFEHPNRQDKNGVAMPFSNLRNPNVLHGRHTTMADPVKEHILLDGVCDNI
jgi:hypothetical protein